MSHDDLSSKQRPVGRQDPAEQLTCFAIGHFRKIFVRCDSLLEPGLVDQTWQKVGGMAQGHPGYSTTAAETDPAGKFVCVAEKLKETKTEVGVTNLLVQQ